MRNIILLLTVFSIVTVSLKAQTPGNSLHYSGQDYVTAPLPAVFNDINSNDFTMEAWVKPQGGAFERIIFAQLNGNSFASISIASSNVIYFYVSVVGMKTTNSLPSNQWSHVVCTWEANTQQAQIYFNGILQTITSGGGSTTGTDNVMAIGSRSDGYQYFSGEIDEVRIWDVVRDDCQITTAMVSEFTVMQPDLVAYYNFNQGVAGGNNAGITTLPDFTTNYDGILHNFTLSGLSSNWVSSGANIIAVNQNASVFNTIDVRSACDSLLWIDGNIYTSNNNTAIHTLSSIFGCDSIVTLNLTIIVVDTSVTVTAPSITANATGATFQWLDCNNAYAIIPGETNQGFTATADGNYAVEITQSGCKDTSACIPITTTGIHDDNFRNDFLVYPNPTDGIIFIELGKEYSSLEVTLRDVSGRVVEKNIYMSTKTISIDIDGPKGFYFVELSTESEKTVFKIVNK